ncbi:MAG: hypothetical protein HQL54_09940 [Magnetococcales bacterium]|nr:hypothetical protein [Magnetococcales bacterium]
MADAANAYKSLLVVERCFRSLKRTEIKMTPMFHRLEKRIEAHVKICVLALLIARVVEHQCGESWFQVKEALKALQVSKIRSGNFEFFQRNRPSEKADIILKNSQPLFIKGLFLFHLSKMA